MSAKSHVKTVAFILALFVTSVAFPADGQNPCGKEFSPDSIPCRLHGFEFCTSDSISDSLRSKVFDALGRVQSSLGFDAVVTDVVQHHLADLDRIHGREVNVVELGSGAGDLVFQLAKVDRSRSYLLTDIFPQVDVWNRKIKAGGSDSNVQYLYTPTSAADISKLNSVPGDVVLTVAMLHHLRPAEVSEFLLQVVQKRLNVIVVEPLARRVRDVFVGAGAGFASLKYYPEGWRDLRIPLILSHDGVVSALRQYTASDLREHLRGTMYQVTETSGLGPVGSFRVMFINPI
jgi:hypothetical protein